MVLSQISVGYNKRLSKYVVKYHRTHYYFGIIKGYSYISKEEMFDDLESAKYSIIQNQTKNKLVIDADVDNALSYSDVVRLSGKDTDYQSD